MNRHASAFMDYFQSVPEPKAISPAPKKAAPPEPVLDTEDLAERVYTVFEALREFKTEDWILEDLMDVIEILQPGYLAASGLNSDSTEKVTE